MKAKILLILKGRRPLIDVWFYVQGNYRYKIYYSKYKWLLREHIREQIEFRIQRMNPECYINGSCIKCGCETTMLQMADKQCDGKCYPEMFIKAGAWEHFKTLNQKMVDQIYPKQNIHVC